MGNFVQLVQAQFQDDFQDPMQCSWIPLARNILRVVRPNIWNFLKILDSLLIFYQQEKLHFSHKQYLKGYWVFECCPMPNKNLDCKPIASKILDCSAMANQDKYHQVHQHMEPLWMYFVSEHQLLRMLNLSFKIKSGLKWTVQKDVSRWSRERRTLPLGGLS